MIWSHESSDCKRRGIWPAVGLCCALGYERTRDSQSDSGHDFSLWLDTDTSRNRNTGGTGLGLYIVRKIMEMHHTEYGIQNTKRGVLFWIKLPIKQSPFNSI